MDALSAVALPCEPTDPRILPLIEAHVAFSQAYSPACHQHTMDAERLNAAGVYFVAVFDEDRAIAMGALKPLPEAHGELKSMHVANGERGAGLADIILDALLDKARALGMGRISLETGSQDAFAPARRFYERRGFSLCPPFADYMDDPASVYYSCDLSL